MINKHISTLAAAWESVFMAVGQQTALYDQPSRQTVAGILLVEDELKRYVSATGDKRLINMLCLIRFGMMSMRASLEPQASEPSLLNSLGAEAYLRKHVADDFHITEAYANRIQRYRELLGQISQESQHRHSAFCDRLKKR